MYIEERVKRLEDRIDILDSDKMFLTHNGYISTEDIVKAICKHLLIEIHDIDNTPTVRK